MSRFPVDAPKNRVVRALEQLGYRPIRERNHICMARENPDGSRSMLDCRIIVASKAQLYAEFARRLESPETLFWKLISWYKQRGTIMRILSFGLALVLVVGIYVAQAVDEDALMLYLPFDDGAGKNPKDASGNENRASIKGNLKWVKGKINGALEFDGGAANFVEVAHSADLEGMKQLTVEAWVQPFGTDALARGIVSKRAAWQNADVYNLFSWNESKFWARVNAKDGQQISSKSLLKDKSWIHLAYMYDGKTKKQLLYVNGELENEVDHPEDEVGKGEKSIWIGILNEGYAQAWNGLIDEVRIWSTVLTEDEIKLSMAGELLLVQSYGKATTTWGRIKKK